MKELFFLCFLLFLLAGPTFILCDHEPEDPIATAEEDLAFLQTLKLKSKEVFIPDKSIHKSNIKNSKIGFKRSELKLRIPSSSSLNNKEQDLSIFDYPTTFGLSHRN